MLKILLLGDSIRLGYRDKVADLLKARARVLGPDENCRFSAFTLFRAGGWASDDDYDLIQWNNGQWDTCYMPDGKIHTPLPQYLDNISDDRVHLTDDGADLCAKAVCEVVQYPSKRGR